MVGKAITLAIGVTVILSGAVASAREPVRLAQSANPPSADAQQAPVPAEPRQTSASFGDWIVRCERPGEVSAKRICEAAQSVVVQGQQAPIAQIAFGRAGDAGAPLLLTVLLPVNIAFDKSPQFGSGTSERPEVTLALRRCLPGGCLADAKVESGLLRVLRGAQKPARLTFTAANERTLALPISLRGLAQALDDLSKEGGP